MGRDSQVEARPLVKQAHSWKNPVFNRTFYKSRMHSAAFRAHQDFSNTLSIHGDTQHWPCKSSAGTWEHELHPPHLHPFVIQPIEISNFTPFNSDMSHLIPNKVGCNVPCSRAEPRRGVCVLSPALLSPQLKGRELSWHNRGCASLHTASHSFSNNILSSWRSYS